MPKSKETSVEIPTSYTVYLDLGVGELSIDDSPPRVFSCPIVKLITSWYKERRWDLKQLVGSGGMPSSHSATVTALAVAVGLQQGFRGSLFATAIILACGVMYDATGVRLQAGRQAEVLNQIVCELPSEHPLAESIPLRELLGHTPPQVVAVALLGLVTATIMHLITGSGSLA